MRITNRLFVLLCFKASETLLGIETLKAAIAPLLANSFKASETLLGIETQIITHYRHPFGASKPLKPF